MKLLSLTILAALLTGCATKNPAVANSHSLDKNTVAPTAHDRDVLLAAIARNQTSLASKLDSNIEKGLVVKNKHRTVERDTKGEIIQIGDSVLYGESDIELRLSTFHELANKVDSLELDIATKSQAQEGTNQVYGTPSFDGLRLKLTGSGGAGLDADNIKAPYAGRALEAEAKEGLLRAHWEGRTGHAATIIDVAGKHVTGIVKEVLKVTTPQGSALAAAELLVEKPDKTSVIVETTEEAQ